MRSLTVTDKDAFDIVAIWRDGGCLGRFQRRRGHVFAALQVAQKLGYGKRVATIIPDSAERYLSKKFSRAANSGSAL